MQLPAMQLAGYAAGGLRSFEYEKECKGLRDSRDGQCATLLALTCGRTLPLKLTEGGNLELQD